MSSSTSPSQSPSSGQTLDRSQSAPAAMDQASAPGLCQDPPGLRDPPLPSSPAEDAGSTPHRVHPHPPPVHSDSKVPPVPGPATDILRTCTPPADENPVSRYRGGEVQPGATEGVAESDEVASSSVAPHPEEPSPIQPMEQDGAEPDRADAAEACPRAPGQADSVEMESPTASHGEVSSERDQPEGEHCSSSDSIPSLAAALKELHELLVSNSQSQNRSASCSPSHPFGQETDEAAAEPRAPTPENTRPDPSTAITAGAEPSDAKANHAAAAAAAVSDEGPSKCLVPDLSGQDERPDGDTPETTEGRGSPRRRPDGPGERRAERRRQDEADDTSIFQPEPEVPPDPVVGDLEIREPPEGQQGRGVADGRASGTNTPDALGLRAEHTFLSPLSMAVGSPEDISSNSPPSSPPLAQDPQLTSPAPLLPPLPPPPPHPVIEQFPAEHIQRIQAAGFSAVEAAEALERAHGVVELALLALLARSITVPT